MNKIFKSIAAFKAAMQKEINATKVLIKLYREYRAKQRAIFRTYTLQDKSSISVEEK